ncbi:amidohydrolase family protein [Conexibacter sp. SYSU D00693]|uniref:amidohydrolase family protein n=1 Tax=Conexibacter sp. SYSU D00693 TaxID=2812560 RepID=UPI00196B21EE|nr:amidohydrolase family protein [Conexibacter sp. SYSU D00693]
MDTVDTHQHLWPEEVLALLEGRGTAPRTRWRDGGWDVELPGEPTFRVTSADHDRDRRAAAVRAAGLDRALVALSSPVGVEALPGEEAELAVAAWTSAAAGLPAELGWWAALPTAAAQDGQLTLLRAALGEGAAGLCLPAGALATPASAEAALPVLALLAERGAPLFVHPGPAAGSPGDPSWWASTTGYVAGQHAAWHAFHAVVRPALPELRVVFALLAGLAPLHAERAAQRGAALDAALDDPRCFYDTSSYGPRAVRALACAVGSGALVHGSDHPVAGLEGPDPVAAALGDGAASLARRENPARLLGAAWIPA